MTTTDPALAAATAAVRESLCRQSALLSTLIERVNLVTVALTPPGSDGWRGLAEAAQSMVVVDIAGFGRLGVDALERARHSTDDAVRSMSDG